MSLPRLGTWAWLVVDLLLIVAFCWLAGACNPFWFLPQLHEGPHRIQPTTAADLERGARVLACLQDWARTQGGHPDANYSDVDLTRLTIVRVGGGGVIGVRTNAQGDTIASWPTAARENGDTLFINEGVDNSTFVGLELHELVHVPQPQHHELVGADGDIHWAPPWDYCHIPRAIFSSG